MTSAFNAYNVFHTLKLHFSKEDYDAIKYGFQTRTKLETFEKRKDVFQYLKWAKKFPQKDRLIHFFLANIIASPSKIWIGDCNIKTYNNWKGRIDGLSYHFEQQIKKLAKEGKPLKEWVDNSNEQLPEIINEYKGGRISLETLTILNLLLNFSSGIECPDFLWKDEKILLKKYPQFLKIDKNKYAKAIVSAFSYK